VVEVGFGDSVFGVAELPNRKALAVRARLSITEIHITF
jgi:hypothetical protein